MFLKIPEKFLDSGRRAYVNLEFVTLLKITEGADDKRLLRFFFCAEEEPALYTVDKAFAKKVEDIMAMNCAEHTVTV